MRKWSEPCDVILIYIRPGTESRCEILTKFDGICITIPKEAYKLEKQGWELERTIPPQHNIEL